MKPATQSSEVAVEKGTEAAGLSHDNPRTPNVHILGTRRFKNTTKIPRKDPKRKKEERKIVAEEGINARNFGPPPFGAPPFGAPPLLGSTLRGGPHTLSSQNSTSKNWPKSKLVKVEIGRSRILAEVDHPPTDLDPNATILSVDGVGAFDLTLRKSMLVGLLQKEGGQQLSFNVLVGGRFGSSHHIVQGEGGEQGDPFMPLLFCLGQHAALVAVAEVGSRRTTFRFPG